MADGRRASRGVHCHRLKDGPKRALARAHLVHHVLLRSDHPLLDEHIFDHLGLRVMSTSCRGGGGGGGGGWSCSHKHGYIDGHMTAAAAAAARFAVVSRRRALSGQSVIVVMIIVVVAVAEHLVELAAEAVELLVDVHSRR